MYNPYYNSRTDINSLKSNFDKLYYSDIRKPFKEHVFNVTKTINQDMLIDYIINKVNFKLGKLIINKLIVHTNYLNTTDLLRNHVKVFNLTSDWYENEDYDEGEANIAFFTIILSSIYYFPIYFPNTVEGVGNYAQYLYQHYFSDDECIICLEPSLPSQSLVKPCPDCLDGHKIHNSCLQRWLLDNNTCPLCRIPCRTGNYSPLWWSSNESDEEKLKKAKIQISDLENELVEIKRNYNFEKRRNNEEKENAEESEQMYLRQLKKVNDDLNLVKQENIELTIDGITLQDRLQDCLDDLLS